WSQRARSLKERPRARAELLRRSVDSLRRFCFIAGTAGGGSLRRYARLVGAPNCAPSLCSVAGLLHALALKAARRTPARLPSRNRMRRAFAMAPSRSSRDARDTP